MTGSLRRDPDPPVHDDTPAPVFGPGVGRSGTTLLPTYDPARGDPARGDPARGEDRRPEAILPIPGVLPARAATPRSKARIAPDGTHWLTPFLSGLVLLVAEGASVGFAGWAFRTDPERFYKFATSNDIVPIGRTFALGNMAIGAAVALLVGLVVGLARWRREGAVLVDHLAKRCSPLVLAGLLPFFFEPRLYNGRELSILALMAVFGLGLQRLTRLSLCTPPAARPILPRAFTTPLDRLRVFRTRLSAAIGRARWLPWLIVIAGAAGYAAHFAYHTVQTHYRMGTASLDLGLEDNLLWNLIHGAKLFKSSPLGGPDASHAGFHQTWFAYVIAPVYALFPRAETLLIIQSVMIAAAAIPLFLLARRRLGSGTAVVLALGYLLYPPVHGSNLYDFHYQPLSAVFLFSALYFLEERRNLLATIAILFAFSLREDISALVAVLGAYLILTGERPRAGIVVALAGLTYFATLKFFIMPKFLGGSEAFVYMYKDLIGPGQKGFGGVLKTVFGNPLYTLGSLLERDKLIYALQLFAPLAFLPFRRSIGLLLALPGFFFTMLSTGYSPTIQISFQYTAWWTTLMFVGCIAALDHLKRREDRDPIAGASRRAFLVAFIGAMLVTSYQYGAILQKQNARGGFGAYRFGLNEQDHLRHKQMKELATLIPRDAKVVASEMIVPHVSNRAECYTLRMGLYDADYLIFELPPSGDHERNHLIYGLRTAGFGVVDVKGMFVLAKKGHPITRNAEVLAMFGG